MILFFDASSLSVCREGTLCCILQSVKFLKMLMFDLVELSVSVSVSAFNLRKCLDCGIVKEFAEEFTSDERVVYRMSILVTNKCP